MITLRLTTLGMALGATSLAYGQAAPETQILLRNVAVWDGTSDAAVPGQSVLIQGKLIKAIGTTPDAAPDAMVLDGGGRVLIPGIIEAHSHLALPLPPSRILNEDWMYVAALSAKVARGVLLRGWTTVRDMGGPSQGLARAIDEGHAIGPRIYPTAMFISQTSGHGDFRGLNDAHPNMGGAPNAWVNRYTLLADGPAEVSRAVREALRQGATSIKVMAGGGISSQYDPIDTTQYSVEELRAAVEAAAQWNTYVSVHAYTDAAVRNALEAGVKVIEHGHLLSEDTLKLLKKKGAFLSSQSFAFFRTLAPPTSAAGDSKGNVVMAGTDTLMNTAKKLGIPVAFGTDAFGSPRLFEAAPAEFGARLRWFTSLEILKQATSVNAQLLALTGPRNPYRDGPLGVIQPGAYADVLLVDGNPLEDIRVLGNPADNLRLIMKDGVIYKNTLKE